MGIHQQRSEVSGDTVRIVLNGEERHIPKGTTVMGLLDLLDLPPRLLAVEVSGRVLSREEFQQVELKEGDVVEIVNFVGGG